MIIDDFVDEEGLNAMYKYFKLGLIKNIPSDFNKMHNVRILSLNMNDLKLGKPE